MLALKKNAEKSYKLKLEILINLFEEEEEGKREGKKRWQIIKQSKLHDGKNVIQIKKN